MGKEKLKRMVVNPWVRQTYDWSKLNNNDYGTVVRLMDNEFINGFLPDENRALQQLSHLTLFKWKQFADKVFGEFFSKVSSLRGFAEAYKKDIAGTSGVSLDDVIELYLSVYPDPSGNFVYPESLVYRLKCFRVYLCCKDGQSFEDCGLLMEE